MALNDPVIALFMFLDKFAFSQILGAIAVVVILIFFVTSADSAMIVMDMLSSNGKNVRQRGKMPFGVRAICVASFALMKSGGLASLGAMTIVCALPFIIALLGAIFGTMKALRIDVINKYKI